MVAEDYKFIVKDQKLNRTVIQVWTDFQFASDIFYKNAYVQ